MTLQYFAPDVETCPSIKTRGPVYATLDNDVTIKNMFDDAIAAELGG